MQQVHIWFLNYQIHSQNAGYLMDTSFLYQKIMEGLNMTGKLNVGKGIKMLAECENCKKQFDITSHNENKSITHKREYKVNGRSIYLTYYDCPSCGRRHFVQIDDKQTLELLKSNRKLFCKLSKKRINDVDIPKKQSDKYKKQTTHLRERRNILMRDFTGVMLHDDDTDKDFELRFSV